MPNILKLLISVALCFAAAVIGSYFTAGSVTAWYANLSKPSFNPPNWLFGPVWSVLYLLMGVSLFLIWKEGTGNSAVKQALLIFAIQLVLNTLWSVIFFGMQSISGALVVIALLIVAIFFTIVKFVKIAPVAGYLMIPYLLWVSFATILNYYLYRLN